MTKNSRRITILFNWMLAVVIFAITSGAIAYCAIVRDGYLIIPGEVSQQKIRATRNVENRLATERNRLEAEKASEAMNPLSRIEPEVDEKVFGNVASYFTAVREVRAVFAREVFEAELKAEAEAKKAEEERKAEEMAAQLAALLELERVMKEEEEAEAGEALGVPAAEVSEEAPAADEILEKAAEPEASQTPAPDPEPEPETTVDTESYVSVELLSSLPVSFTREQSLTILGADDEGFASLEHAVGGVLAGVLEQGVPEKDVKTLLSIQDGFNVSEIKAELRAVGYEIASYFIEPNYLVDEESTEMARHEIAENYRQVMLLNGQTIVDEGDIITQEIYEILNSLGLISEGIAGKIVPVASSAMVASIVLVFVMVYIRQFNKHIYARKRESFLLFMLYAFVLAVIIYAVRTPISVPYMILPVFILPLLAAMLIDIRFGIVLSVAMAVIALLIYEGGIGFFIFFSAGGMFVCLLSRFTTERSKIFIAGILASAVCFALMFSITLFLQKSYSQSVLIDSSYAALNGIVTILLCVGSLPFWEAMFGMVTKIKLLDLTNPSNPLLRRLTIEAPGTYHHSLIVANLSESAAFDIKADPNIARVGGYYHDIGKLKDPLYFSENIAGPNPHDFLMPLESVGIIISHVSHGLDLANQYRLPNSIKEIISHHHGSSLLKFFYHKAKNGGADEEIDEADYRYPRRKPQTKEAAIVMLADTVEAAVRSFSGKTIDLSDIDRKIGELIKDKLDDGQLIDSQFTIKDLNTAAEAFMRVLRGMYHDRIPYPTPAPSPPEPVREAEA